jgi:hypothetical protein
MDELYVDERTKFEEYHQDVGYVHGIYHSSQHRILPTNVSLKG